MKVELSIADDRELRQHIRDVIAGEVKGIARGEIKGIIAEVFSEKVLPKEDGIERLIREVIRDEVERVLRERATGYMSESWIRSEARLILSEMLKELVGGGRILK